MKRQMMNKEERECRLERHKKYLLEDNRLIRWNHVRQRANKPCLTLEQAAELLLNPTMAQDVKDYLDD